MKASPIKKILIANRGEIACRIIKTANRLGIATVAIYSDIDKTAKHVRMADEAYCVGLAPSLESYLNQTAIIDIAKQTKVDAIHPGYGFLAENASFAKRCQAENINFIGPSHNVIALMGDKQRAKQLMQQASIPTVPGYQGEQQSDDELYQHALTVGFPLLIKASQGGGGKGMRLVHQQDQLKAAISSAKREAKTSFGDDNLILEKYLIKSRHIEAQILRDTHGHTLYLLDRDCSIQRRHQKIIEEAPAPNIPDAIRKAMSEAAITAANTIDYHGAGTIEFLLTPEGDFYFMEMNTRLQVEHPVTEMICDIDIVEWQIRIASQETLNISQQQISANGHAIEARLYAEDPFNDFAPSTGSITIFNSPPESKQLRIDSGIDCGDSISVYYDPLIAKYIVHSQNREQAIKVLLKILNHIIITGITTNLALLYRVLAHHEFMTEAVHTEFIQQHQNNLLKTEQHPPLVTIIAASIGLWRQQHQQHQQLAQQQQHNSPWLYSDGWRESMPAHISIQMWYQQQHYAINIQLQKSAYLWTWQQQQHQISIQWQSSECILILNQETVHLPYSMRGNTIILMHQGQHYDFSSQYPNINHSLTTSGRAGLTAPMPGIIQQICVTIGQTVNTGDPLVLMEAMKMEHTIVAPYHGKITAIQFQGGDRVSNGDTLIEIAGTDAQDIKGSP